MGGVQVGYLGAPENRYPEIRELFLEYQGPHFDGPDIDAREPILFYGVTDHARIGYMIQSDIFVYKDMCVEISAQKGLDYGTSYGYEKGVYVTGSESLPIQNQLNPLEQRMT